MRRLVPVAVLLCAFGLLSGCQASLKGKASSDVTPNAIMGDAIEVTALDAAPGAATPPVGVDAKPEGKGTTDAQAPAVAEPGAKTASDATVPEPAATEPPTSEASAAAPAPTPDLAETPVTPKSEMQLACEKKRGKWSAIGKGELRACVYQTKDAGKSCTRESQCDGVCLARSGTCAPFKPLYGCNEILQDDGARVTLCID